MLLLNKYVHLQLQFHEIISFNSLSCNLSKRAIASSLFSTQLGWFQNTKAPCLFASIMAFSPSGLIIKFASLIEKVCVETVESGSMTKDLAILIDKTSKYLTTNQFLEAINSNLKKKLN